MKKAYRDVEKCRICHSRRLFKFLDLGSMPIPNGFLERDKLKTSEQKFELACLFCEDCCLVQLSIVVNPALMFKNYVYIPSMAKVMMNNFGNLAFQIYKEFKLNKSSLVVDIGSNDGSLLTFFKNFEVKVLGIDPAKNLAKLAEMKGIPTEVKFFNARNAKQIVKKYGKADVITATNVIAHIDNLHQVFEGVASLLAKDGVFVTEFPYLVDLIKKNEFDTIYHEHLSYFSLKPWIKLISLYGFEIIGVQRLLIHGGSIRLIHRKKSRKSNKALNTVKYLLSVEENQGLYSTKALIDFARRIENLKVELMELLTDLKKKRKKIIGYGAAAKGNVLTNYFGIGTNILDYIVDSTPYKQGLFTPGVHIPVYGESRIAKDRPDYILILAWNFADEIIEKEREFKKNGGKFIIPIPKIKIV
ncbi:MAG: class I SAM-dependent methyltransferase [Candidatus Curtissbacteria bacterium]|nr:class I SAM-dependent methyltransferase [Candidatus Curtissbacteria bacterium]